MSSKSFSLRDSNPVLDFVSEHATCNAASLRTVMIFLTSPSYEVVNGDIVTEGMTGWKEAVQLFVGVRYRVHKG